MGYLPKEPTETKKKGRYQILQSQYANCNPTYFEFQDCLREVILISNFLFQLLKF